KARAVDEVTDRDRDEGLVERGLADGDLGEPGSVAEVEEMVEERLAQIEIHEAHPLTRAGESDREVRDRRRLPLLLDRARDHDRLDVAAEANELEVRPQHPERLGAESARLDEHRELLLLA